MARAPGREVNEALEQFLEQLKDHLVPGIEMPVIEDYMLVVAIRDLNTEQGGAICTVSTTGAPIYRIRGLMEIGLEQHSVGAALQRGERDDDD